MKKSKRKLLLIFAGVLIGLLIPAFAFADDSSPATTFGPGDSVKVDEEHFPDNSFRAYMIYRFNLDENNPVLKYDDAVKARGKKNFDLEFEKPNYKGFEYLAAIINGRKDLSSLDITAPPGGQPFPFDLINGDVYKNCSTEINGAGEENKLPNITKLSSANQLKYLTLCIAVEDDNMKLDLSKFSNLKMLGLLRFTKTGVPTIGRPEKPIKLNLIFPEDKTNLDTIKIEAITFDLDGNLDLSGMTSLKDLEYSGIADRIKLNNCPKLRGIQLSGTYVEPRGNKGTTYRPPTYEEWLTDELNKYAGHCKIKEIDVSGCSSKKVTVTLSFTDLEKIIPKDDKQLIGIVMNYFECGSFTTNDFATLRNFYYVRNDPNQNYYYTSLKRNEEGKLFIDMNDIVGEGKAKYAKFAPNEKLYKWDPKSGHLVFTFPAGKGFPKGGLIYHYNNTDYTYHKSYDDTERSNFEVQLIYKNTKPTVMLSKDVKDKTITINQGETFDPTKYAQVSDVEDLAKPRKIGPDEVISNNVDTSKIGEYEVTYQANDDEKLKSDPVTVKVVVQEDPVAKELNKAKADKKAELENINFTIEDESKYTEESVAAAKAKFDELKREALAKVDKVTLKEELNDISINMDDAKALLETKEAADAELLNKAKADKKTDLENISFNIEDESKYTEESVTAAKAKFDELKREALAKVDKVTSKEELNDISINMDDARALLVTKEAADAELLKKAKADKKTELENISFNIEDESKYTEESVAAAKAKFDELKREALAKVDKVTSKEELNDISINVEDAKTLLKLSSNDNSSSDTILKYNFLEKPVAAVDVANGGKVEFRIDAEYEHFLNKGAVYVDDTELTIDKDYTSREGSTIIDLTPSFLKSLAPGKHSFRATFDGGKGEAVTEFEIAKSANELTPSSHANSNNVNRVDNNSTKTGDEVALVKYILVLLLGTILLFIFIGGKKYEKN